jgi:hypothetical protein
MEFLAEAGRKGQIDKETYDKVAAEIARSLADLGAFDKFQRDGSPDAEAVERKRWNSRAFFENIETVPVDDVAVETAALLAEMAADAPEGWAERPEKCWDKQWEEGSARRTPASGNRRPHSHWRCCLGGKYTICGANTVGPPHPPTGRR